MVDKPDPDPGTTSLPLVDRALAWMGGAVAQFLQSPLVAPLPRHKPRANPPARPPVPAPFVLPGSVGWHGPELPRPDQTTLPPPGDLHVLTAQFPIVHTDDDSCNLQLIELMLTRAGLSVVSFPGAAETLYYCQHERVSLVVTDVMKPDIGGFELAERLRRDPLTSQIPVMFVTACASDHCVMQGLALGAVGYLTKPISPAELLGAVEDALITYGHWRVPGSPIATATILRRMAREGRRNRTLS